MSFEIRREFPHNSFCIFGKSRPDFAFFKKYNQRIQAGVIIQPVAELQEIKMYGTALEFKLDISHDPTRVFPQAFADKIRVANDILIDALRVRKVVDYIVVYALLVAYNKEECMPLKYVADFCNNHFQILVGEKDTFHELFPLLAFMTVH